MDVAERRVIGYYQGTGMKEEKNGQILYIQITSIIKGTGYCRYIYIVTATPMDGHQWQTPNRHNSGGTTPCPPHYLLKFLEDHPSSSSTSTSPTTATASTRS